MRPDEGMLGYVGAVAIYLKFMSYLRMLQLIMQSENGTAYKLHLAK